MIKLYQFPPAWGLPNASPFCMKLETYLRMARLPYQTITLHSPRKAPKGKLPYIEDDGKTIADSGLIIESLKAKYADILDKQLTSAEKATSLAVRRLIEENLYWVLAYSRWIEDKGFEKMKTAFFGSLPPIIRQIIPHLVRRQLAGQMRGHGLGRHTRSEIYQIGMDDLTSLADFVADKPYFLGKNPTTLDATAYAFLANIIWAPVDSPLKKHMLRLANLGEYCVRMRERFYEGAIQTRLI